ncbi:MAG: hypothetical protein HC836_02525 [Richelia sp. RM2_1_2]|nr:hypothetical protein [Rivularia sp. T60_A2020_040]NJM21036.1 hypothetical protein [Richelia sp. SM1_7_0]NJN08542.1 hypothetical protein [Richelia sp. RM1_1_1]NJO27560.1 hypothetical protein [Richelia sp. SL_2_1]NJO57285.1 hypothetical protein [Richelia sp. RM2_1_2]
MQHYFKRDAIDHLSQKPDEMHIKEVDNGLLTPIHHKQCIKTFIQII